ncbi:MAG: D-amino acid dehydrogenase [Lautropia sp.]
MRVLILGSGVIGVTTAWYLANAGADVTVVDRQPDVALETSHANAGQISPGYSTPWAAPGIPLKALRWMFERHAPLAIRLDGSLFQLQWLAAMLANCSARRYAVNKERMLRLATYSRACLQRLRDETGIAYEGRQLGTTQVFRKPSQMAGLDKDLDVLRAMDIAHEVLDPAGLRAVEPGLDVAGAGIVGALRLPGDETGDCNLFTRALARKAAEIGVRFLHGHEVDRLERTRGRVRGAWVRASGTGPDAGRDGLRMLEADEVVVAMASYSRALLRDAGIRVPVYPLKGYSLTVPIASRSRAPVSTVMDETYKIAVTRFDDRIRVGGMAEVAGFDLRLDARRRQTLEMVANSLFPGAGHLDAASFWTGLRPMTPDGTPIVGRAPLAGLWINTGHGTLGWTMACGSGRLLADQITGRDPEISARGLGLDRDEGRANPKLGHLGARPSNRPA